MKSTLRNVKAMWLSQYDLNRVYCDGVQRPSADFRHLLEKIFTNVKNTGHNTVIVQVRPNADSMYPSDYYPPSAYVTGTYGRDFLYDPLRIIVDEARAMGLSVHGWINPLRCMTTEQFSSLAGNSLFRRIAPECFSVVEGRLYLDPANPEARDLIISGAAELARNYDLDGIHMDDYFYPTVDESFDSRSYCKYISGGGTADLPTFRRHNLDLLVKGLYTAVKAVDSRLLFGISPAGNIDNVYNKQFADVYRWCSEAGYVDYICPQVYFGLEHETCDFRKVCGIWQDIIKNGTTQLWIGMTLGKAKSKTDRYAGCGGNEWAENRDILRRCLEHTLTLPKCRGVSYFCYQYYFDPVTAAEETATREERENFLPLLKEIKWK